MHVACKRSNEGHSFLGCIRPPLVQGWRQRADGAFEDYYESFGDFDNPQGPAYFPPKPLAHHGQWLAADFLQYIQEGLQAPWRSSLLEEIGSEPRNWSILPALE
jgi:hypothetical protein